jgi:hypothetical protein
MNFASAVCVHVRVYIHTYTHVYIHVGTAVSHLLLLFAPVSTDKSQDMSVLMWQIQKQTWQGQAEELIVDSVSETRTLDVQKLNKFHSAVKEVRVCVLVEKCVLDERCVP